MWPDDDTFFPDWTSPVTQQWWVDQITAFHDQLQFDGLWIDMNEPANFVAGSVQGCANNSLNFPPYKPGTEGADLLQKTVCLDAVQEAGLHYDLHSLYGWTETEPTLRGARLATGGRSLVLSRYNMWIIQIRIKHQDNIYSVRSTFVGSGRWTAHWLGDNWSLWDNLHASIVGMLQFNQFGIPLVGLHFLHYLYYLHNLHIISQHTQSTISTLSVTRSGRTSAAS